jgi:hypothetical protein
MVISTNVRGAPKMMYQNTGIKILKKSAPMTARGAKNQSASRLMLRSIEPGGKKMFVVNGRTMQYDEPSSPGQFCELHALDVEKKSPWLITRIMTSLWK